MVMRGGFLVLVFVAGLTGPAGADATGVPEADRIQIRSVVERQIAAFQQDDGETAFSFASPNIRALFVTTENFMAMVRKGYPAVYRPRQVRFEAPVVLDGAPVQPVHVVGPDGAPVLALYTMQRQPDGAWKINGVQLLVKPGKAT